MQGGTAGEIAAANWLGIIAFCQCLTSHGYYADGAFRKIQRGPLVSHEFIAEPGTLVPAVVADDGEAAGEGGAIGSGHRANGRTDRTVQPAAALQEVPPGPDQRQREFEADAVFDTACSSALVDRSGDKAMRGHLHGRAAEAGRDRAPGEVEGGGSDFHLAHALPHQRLAARAEIGNWLWRHLRRRAARTQ